MIEKTLIEYLTRILDVPVLAERDPNQKAPFVIIEKTGSSTFNYITTATIAVQSYAASLLEAATLNDEVIQALKASIELPSISSAQLNSDYNYTDTASKQYRYQAVFDFVYF